MIRPWITKLLPIPSQIYITSSEIQVLERRSETWISRTPSPFRSTFATLMISVHKFVSVTSDMLADGWSFVLIPKEAVFRISKKLSWAEYLLGVGFWGELQSWKLAWKFTISVYIKSVRDEDGLNPICPLTFSLGDGMCMEVNSRLTSFPSNGHYYSVKSTVSKQSGKLIGCF